MKKQCKSAAVAAMFLAAGVAAYAQQAPAANAASPLYGELAYAPVKIKDEGASLGTSKNVRGILGYELHPNLAVEALASFGVSDGHITVQGVRVDTGVDHMYGLYVKPKLTLTSDLELFGRVGYVRSKLSVRAEGHHDFDSESDASYGLGLAYRINDRLSAVVDYTRYYDKDNLKLQGLSAGLRWKF